MGANKIDKNYVQREMQLIDVTAEKNQWEHVRVCSRYANRHGSICSWHSSSILTYR